MVAKIRDLANPSTHNLAMSRPSLCANLAKLPIHNLADKEQSRRGERDGVERTCTDWMDHVQSLRRCVATEGDGVPATALAIAMVRIFGAFLVVVGLALLVASLLQGLSGN